jgi:Putative beta-barrel porin-2, OmpL-like. bbp2
MNLNPNRILQTVAGTAMAFALLAGAQTPAPPAPAPAATPAAGPAATAAPAADQTAAAPAAPAAPTWSVGPMDISGFIDGYYSLNFNRPTVGANGEINDLYNFNDKTDQFNLSAAKLTLNHDPDPIGAHVDFIYGRTNNLINAAPTNSSSADQLNYIEQAFLSLKPPKAKGFELDFGKFVTSAGAEVIEAKDNWNYSRSLLFVNAIPYWHFGARTSIPVSKTDTIGFQLVNGWNNVSKNNGGITGAFTNALTKPKYTWSFNDYIGSENNNTAYGVRNLIDTTLLLTPPGKFNAYLNYDFGSNMDAIEDQGNNKLNTWQGGAVAFHEQETAKSAFSGRYEYFTDPQGFQTGTKQNVQEVTGTYEYKWVEGLLTRFEYRGDFSSAASFHKDATQMVKQQQTITIAFIAFFGPKR